MTSTKQSLMDLRRTVETKFSSQPSLVDVRRTVTTGTTNILRKTQTFMSHHIPRHETNANEPPSMKELLSLTIRKLPSRESFCIRVKRSDEISACKEKIQKLRGIPANNIRLTLSIEGRSKKLKSGGEIYRHETIESLGLFPDNEGDSSREPFVEENNDARLDLCPITLNVDTPNGERIVLKDAIDVEATVGEIEKLLEVESRNLPSPKKGSSSNHHKERFRLYHNGMPMRRWNCITKYNVKNMDVLTLEPIEAASQTQETREASWRSNAYERLERLKALRSGESSSPLAKRIRNFSLPPRPRRHSAAAIQHNIQREEESLSSSAASSSRRESSSRSSRDAKKARASSLPPVQTGSLRTSRNETSPPPPTPTREGVSPSQATTAPLASPPTREGVSSSQAVASLALPTREGISLPQAVTPSTSPNREGVPSSTPSNDENTNKNAGNSARAYSSIREAVLSRADESKTDKKYACPKEEALERREALRASLRVMLRNPPPLPVPASPSQSTGNNRSSVLQQATEDESPHKKMRTMPWHSSEDAVEDESPSKKSRSTPWDSMKAAVMSRTKHVKSMNIRKKKKKGRSKPRTQSVPTFISLYDASVPRAGNKKTHNGSWSSPFPPPSPEEKKSADAPALPPKKLETKTRNSSWSSPLLSPSNKKKESSKDRPSFPPKQIVVKKESFPDRPSFPPKQIIVEKESSPDRPSSPPEKVSVKKEYSMDRRHSPPPEKVSAKKEYAMDFPSSPPKKASVKKESSTDRASSIKQSENHPAWERLQTALESFDSDNEDNPPKAQKKPGSSLFFAPIPIEDEPSLRSILKRPESKKSVSVSSSRQVSICQSVEEEENENEEEPSVRSILSLVRNSDKSIPLKKPSSEKSASSRKSRSSRSSSNKKTKKKADDVQVESSAERKRRRSRSRSKKNEVKEESKGRRSRSVSKKSKDKNESSGRRRGRSATSKKKKDPKDMTEKGKKSRSSSKKKKKSRSKSRGKEKDQEEFIQRRKKSRSRSKNKTKGESTNRKKSRSRSKTKKSSKKNFHKVSEVKIRKKKSSVRKEIEKDSLDHPSENHPLRRWKADIPKNFVPKTADSNDGIPASPVSAVAETLCMAIALLDELSDSSSETQSVGTFFSASHQSTSATATATSRINTYRIEDFTSDSEDSEASDIDTDSEHSRSFTTSTKVEPAPVVSSPKPNSFSAQESSRVVLSEKKPNSFTSIADAKNSEDPDGIKPGEGQLPLPERAAQAPYMARTRIGMHYHR